VQQQAAQHAAKQQARQQQAAKQQAAAHASQQQQVAYQRVAAQQQQAQAPSAVSVASAMEFQQQQQQLAAVALAAQLYRGGSTPLRMKDVALTTGPSSLSSADAATTVGASIALTPSSAYSSAAAIYASSLQGGTKSTSPLILGQADVAAPALAMMLAQQVGLVGASVPLSASILSPPMAVHRVAPPPFVDAQSTLSSFGLAAQLAPVPQQQVVAPASVPSTTSSFSADNLLLSRHHVPRGIIRKSPSSEPAARAVFNEWEDTKNTNRAANRRSAQLSRKKQKMHIEDLKDENSDLRRKELILMSIPDLIVVFDSSGVLSYVSRSVSRFLNFDAEELEGSSFWDRISDDSVRVVKAAFMDALAVKRREGEEDSTPLSSGANLSVRLVDRTMAGGEEGKHASLKGVVSFAGDRPECVCSIGNNADK